MREITYSRYLKIIIAMRDSDGFTRTDFDNAIPGPTHHPLSDLKKIGCIRRSGSRFIAEGVTPHFVYVIDDYAVTKLKQHYLRRMS